MFDILLRTVITLYSALAIYTVSAWDTICIQLVTFSLYLKATSLCILRQLLVLLVLIETSICSLEFGDNLGILFSMKSFTLKYFFDVIVVLLWGTATTNVVR